MTKCFYFPKGTASAHRLPHPVLCYISECFLEACLFTMSNFTILEGKVRVISSVCVGGGGGVFFLESWKVGQERGKDENLVMSYWGRGS